jgi:hypothetical protein
MKLQDTLDKYTGCKVEDLPLKYLGILIHFRKLHNVDQKRMEE